MKPLHGFHQNIVLQCFVAFEIIIEFLVFSRPIHLYLIFEKSSLKIQVWQTGFLTFKNWFLQATQALKILFEID